MRSGSQPPSAEGDSGEGRERSEDEQRPLRQVCSGDRPFSTSATGADSTSSLGTCWVHQPLSSRGVEGIQYTSLRPERKLDKATVTGSPEPQASSVSMARYL